MTDNSKEPSHAEQVLESANHLAEKFDSDVLLFNSGFMRGIDDDVILKIRSRRRRKNLLLILVTEGGDPDAAYRISRFIQNSYEKFTAFVPGYCKSAGTLCVLGANSLIMSDSAELGPLDIQLYKRDEIGESSSGLVAGEALTALQNKAFGMYEEFFLAIKNRSQNQITFKTASEIALKLAIGLVEPLYQQIDPIQVGEMARSMRIAKDYGQRLRVRSKNFTSDSLEMLLETYPSHGFVIDRSEAQSLLKSVREPSQEEEVLVTLLGDVAHFPGRQQCVRFLSDERLRNVNETSDKARAEDSDSDTEGHSRRDAKVARSAKKQTAPSDNQAPSGTA